jgi:hypothetical protein
VLPSKDSADHSPWPGKSVKVILGAGGRFTGGIGGGTGGGMGGTGGGTGGGGGGRGAKGPHCGAVVPGFAVADADDCEVLAHTCDADVGLDVDAVAEAAADADC